MSPKACFPLVAIDVGNSQIKAGLFAEPPGSEAELPRPSRTVSLDAEHWEPVEIALWLAPRKPTDVTWWLASVRHDAARRLQEWLDQERPAAQHRWLSYQHLRLPIDLQEPNQVGIDRLLGALAADRLRPQERPAVIIDLGSAITVDVVSAQGHFTGGAILPGLRMSARALHEFTDQLPDVSMSQLEQAPPLVGTSTDEAIASGLFWGAVGAIRSLVEQLNEQMRSEPFIVLTGGAAASVVEAIGLDVTFEPDLVLSGMALAASQMVE